MIAEAIDRILALAGRNRPPLLELQDHSERKFIYDDKTQGYIKLEPYCHRTRQVSTVQSLAAMVRAEIARAPLMQTNDTGAPFFPTVIFTPEGAAFHLDDDDGRTVFGFKRRLAPGYERVQAAIGKATDHLTFVRLLQGIREFIADPSVLAAYRQITFDSNTRVDSQPLLVDGRVGHGYNLELTVKAGAVEAVLPDQINLLLPFARGGDAWPVQLAVDIQLKDKTPYFSLAWPEHASFVENAVDAEIRWFRETVSDLADLVVLENL